MANKTRKTKTAKSKKTEQVRFSFESAAAAKAVEERLNVKSSVNFVRTGRTITISERSIKALDNAAKAEGASATEVAGRGRPKADVAIRHVGIVRKGPKPKTRTKASVKSNKRRHDLASVVAGLHHEVVPKASAVRRAQKAALGKSQVPAGKKHKMVVLTPSSADAKKLAKALGLDAKQDGARVIIMDSDTSAVRIAVKSNARTLEMPIKLESGFDTPSVEVKKNKKAKAVSRRPEAKKIKKPSERTKPVWRLECKSSNIARASYNLSTSQLIIEFHTGKRYRYDDVKLKEFVAFTTAESQGQWFSENIKDVKDYVKLKDKA